ncbi:esterase/lipase family protein [Okibacterium fritillariae]|uniref:esterase/lipase family protein n=1 Tax=Okibacterium fritillariae TaxID=123320 RepID=UPI00405597DE
MSDFPVARPSLVQEAVWTTADFIESARLHAEAALHPNPPERYRHGDPSKPTVLLLPGVYETWNFLRVIADALNEDGYRIAAVGGLGYNLLPIAETATRLTRALRALAVPSGGRVILAHSKGGLIGKYLLRAHGTELGIEKLTAIATPFAGSRRARYMLDPRLRIFDPADETIVQLGADASVNPRITSIFGTFDAQVPDGSVLSEARNVQVPVHGHFKVLSAPETLAAVRQSLTA